MLIDKKEIDEVDYLCLLYILNAGGSVEFEGKNPPAGAVVRAISAIDKKAFITRLGYSLRQVGRLEQLWEKGLISREGAHYTDFTDSNRVGVSLSGVAFLVNYAAEYLDRISATYGEVPENLTASLIPYLELNRVPKADRYIRTAEAPEHFQELQRQLDIIYDELLRDENKNELPLLEKRALRSDIEGLQAQIKSGYVRLSDLTTRLRPMVHNIAELCKDFVVIAGAASAAALAIKHILTAIF